MSKVGNAVNVHFGPATPLRPDGSRPKDKKFFSGEIKPADFVSKEIADLILKDSNNKYVSLLVRRNKTCEDIAGLKPITSSTCDLNAQDG